MTRRGPLVAIVLALAATGCWSGRGLKFDARRLEERCAVAGQAPVDREQALCIARLAGLRDRRDCPLWIEEVEGDGLAASWRVTENCAPVGILIRKRDGAVIGVRLGEGKAP